MTKTAWRRIAIGSVLTNAVLFSGINDLIKRHNAVVDANRLFMKKIDDAGLEFDDFEQLAILKIASDIKNPGGFND